MSIACRRAGWRSTAPHQLSRAKRSRRRISGCSHAEHFRCRPREGGDPVSQSVLAMLGRAGFVGVYWVSAFAGATPERQSTNQQAAMTDWINIVVQGVLVGGLYAMFAAGLSLIFGVMRLVNIAHGDLIVLAAYLALVTTQSLGLDPLMSLVIVVPLMAAIGYALQWLVLNRTLGDDLLPPLLVTFGLSVIIQNTLQELFTADPQKLQAGAIEVASLRVVEGINIGVLPLLQFALAVVVIAALQLVFYRTALGRAFRATADDSPVAQLMGLDNRHVFALAMALSLAVVAIAGVLLAVRANCDPTIGPARLIFGFEAVIIGGLGSLWGTLAGGIMLGVAQAVGAKLDPGWQILTGHLAFLVVLAIRPQGLFPKVQG